MSRRTGPTLGAGTVIIEKEAGKSIQPAPFGTTVYVGRTEKGETDKLLACPNQRAFLANCGTYIPDSELPDSAFDLHNLSNGSANLYVVRVTDGTEIGAACEVFSRHPGNGEYLDRDAGAFARKSMFTVQAKSGGRWGGAARQLAFSVTPATDVTETTLITGVTMLEDEFVGASITLDGVATGSYRVVSNTAAGVLTVESDSTMAADLAAGTPGNGRGVIALDTEEREYTSAGQRAGDRKALSVLIADGEDTDGNYFALWVLQDGAVVRKYPNLSMDSGSKYYVDTVINQDPDNVYIEVGVTYAGSTSGAYNRPGNYVAEFLTFASNVLTIDVCHPKLVSSVDPNVGFINAFTVPATAVRGQYTVEMTSASAFNVYATGDGLEAADGVLGTGTVGTPWVPSTAADFVPGFTVLNGEDAFQAGDEFLVIVDPLPTDLASSEGLLSGYVYPDMSSGAKVAIDDNTANTITLKNAPAATPTANTAIEDSLGETLLGTAITFPTASIALTMDLVTDAEGLVQVSVVAAVYASIGDLITALNGAMSAGSKFFIESTATTDALAIDHSLYTASSEVGADCFIHVISGQAALNLDGDTTASGARGDRLRVEAAMELIDGYDGADPIDADYLAAFNTVTSVINRLAGKNVGLAKIACPGVTATAVQRGGLAYAEAKNYQFRVEIPSNITTEASAVAYINDTIGRNDYGVVAWPSYGYVVNPLGEGLVLRTLTGAIHGREAGMARDAQGYHKAAAGESVTIPHLIKDILDGAPLDEEVLNPAGIAPIKKVKGNYIIWGSRTIALDPAWKWKHQREYLSHIEHVLQENFDWLIFAINDPSTQTQVMATLQAFFIPEWQKRALQGGTLTEAAAIKIDGENNTALTRANGDLNAEIILRLADTVERFIITVGKKGIFDAAA